MIEYCLILYLQCKTVDCVNKNSLTPLLILDNRVFKNSMDCIKAAHQYKNKDNYGYMCGARYVSQNYSCSMVYYKKSTRNNEN